MYPSGHPYPVPYPDMYLPPSQHAYYPSSLPPPPNQSGYYPVSHQQQQQPPPLQPQNPPQIQRTEASPPSPPTPTPTPKRQSLDPKSIILSFKHKDSFLNTEYQKECLAALFNSVSKSSPGYSTEVFSSLKTQLTTQQPYLHDPEHCIPILRFDCKATPYFEFYYRSTLLPWAQDDITQWIRHVDKEIAEYSMAIYVMIYIGAVEDGQTSRKDQEDPGVKPEVVNQSKATSVPHQNYYNSSPLPDYSNFGSIQNQEASLPIRKRSYDSTWESTDPSPNHSYPTESTFNPNSSTKKVRTETRTESLSQNSQSSKTQAGSSGSSSSARPKVRPRRRSSFVPKRYQPEVIQTLEDSDVSDDDDDFVEPSKSQSHRKSRQISSSASEDDSESEKENPQKQRRRGRRPGTVARSSSTSAKRTRPTATCEYCGEVFSRAFTCNRHVLGVHLNKKPFVCTWGRGTEDACDYSCSQRFQTIAHIKTMHLASGKKKNEDPVKYLEVKEELLLNTSK